MDKDIATTNAAQEGGEVIAWVDGDGDGSYGPPAETLVGHWKVRDKVILKPDPGQLSKAINQGSLARL